MAFEEFGALEAAGWRDGRTAAGYARAFTSITSQAIDPALDAVGARPGIALLDVCCGHGALTAAAVGRGAEVTGLDFSAAMLEEARRRAPAARLLEGDAQAMPFAAGSFDAVICTLGLPHLPDPQRGLAEMRRVLREGGRLAVSDWCGPHFNAAFRIALTAVRDQGDEAAAAGMPAAPAMCAFSDPAFAAERLGAAGFSGIAVREIGAAATFADPDGLFEMLLHGTVRFASILRAQPEDRLAAIRTAMSDAVAAECAVAGGFRVPMPMALVTATAA